MKSFPASHTLNQTRAASLKGASSTLREGNQAYYLKVDTLGALERFAHWYDGV